MDYTELQNKFRRIVYSNYPNWNVLEEIADDLADYAHQQFLESDEDESATRSSIEDIAKYGVPQVYIPKYNYDNELQKFYQSNIFELDAIADYLGFRQIDSLRFQTLSQYVVRDVAKTILDKYNDFIFS